MTLDECLAALTAIREAHGGDLPVLHHDDWDHFLVEEIRFEPVQDGSKPIPEDAVQPAHVVLTGDRRRFQDDGSLA